MNDRNKRKPVILTRCVYAVVLFLTTGALTPLHAQEKIPPAPPPPPPTIDVTRDKEKTVYTIGPGDRRYEMEERDRAWDMLRNMTPVIDGRRGPLQRNQQQQPAK